MNNDTIQQAVETLKNGGTILYPTDTIWGLGCDATNDAACQKILDIKQRPENKSFVLLADSFHMVERYIPDFANVVYDLVDLAVEPLTIIYPNARDLSPLVLAEDGSVGIRITKDPICLKLIKGMHKPLVSTSANLTNQPFGKDLTSIDPLIKNKVDFIVQARTTEKLEKASQIIKIDLDGRVTIIRS
ncbi:MAG: L-threonylcarbamoyladenylate synthase [Crocinitomicaceae bacterium]